MVLTSSAISFAQGTGVLPPSAYNSLRSRNEFRDLEKQLRRDGIKLGAPSTTYGEFGVIVRFTTDSPKLPTVLAVLDKNYELRDIIMVRVPVVGIIDTVQVAGKIEVHSLLSGTTKVVDPESQGFQTMTIVGELILIASVVIWQGFNWVLIQALSNGSLTYDLFWGVVIGTVYWSIDRYGNIGDQPIWVYSTAQTYLYGVTIEPNGNILYH
ncbi:MAG: hypothetical protein KGZ53_04360 [Peptococcaceae bacterium]|nr:hypothetical protein [Peptococcaceae bacterium]